MNQSDGELSRSSESDPASRHDTPSDGSPQRSRPVAPKRRRPFRVALGWIGAAFAFAAIVILLAVAALESGLIDGFLTQRVRVALQAALGPSVSIDIASAAVRLSPTGIVQLEAQGVQIADAADPSAIASARSLSLDLAPVPLLSGHVSVTDLTVDGAFFDPRSFGSDKPFDIAAVRIDALGTVMDHVFTIADRLANVLKSRASGVIRLSDTRIDDGKGGSPPVVIRSMMLSRQAGGALSLVGDVVEGGRAARLTARATPDPKRGHVGAIDVTLTGLDTEPLLVQEGPDGEPKVGIKTTADLSLRARRAVPGRQPSLNATVNLAPGTFFADGVPAELKASSIALGYRFDRGSIEVLPSVINVGASKFPFSGGIIDLSNLDKIDGTGFAIDLIIDQAVSAPLDSDEPSLPFNAKLFGRFLKLDKVLELDQMAIATPLGSLAGSLHIVGGGKSPEISFAARIAKMETGAVKQLWPFWIAKKAREWVLKNLYGGSVTNGSIRLFIPKDQIAEAPEGLKLGADQLQIDFDYERARLNVAGDIPPLRDAAGHLKLRGNRLEVGLNTAAAYFPTGRMVDVSNGLFAIPDTDAHPLMGDLDISVSGKADAVGELVSYRPINALERTRYKPEDFTGSVTSHVKAVFGLIQEQDPPPPDWTVDAKLDGVDLGPKVDGRDLTDLVGTLEVDPEKAVLDADAKVDGVPMHLALTEPLDDRSPAEKQRVVSARLDSAGRKILLPGLNEVLDGPVDVTLTRTGEGIQSVKADLTDATITVPGLGWTKGKGVSAHSDFTAKDDGKSVTIDDFSLAGEGFSVDGALTITDSSLTSARFSRVKLSPRDSFAVDLKREAKRYRIDVSGSSIDLRSLIENVKDSRGSGGGGDAASVTLHGQVDTAYGFNDERLGNVAVSYSGRGDRIDSLDMKAVTRSGEALIARMTPDGGATNVELTCGDGGALARFTGVYAKLEGGLLNIRLRKSEGGPYRGTLDIRDFSVTGEGRLNSLVSSSGGSNGPSLRDTVKEPLDLNHAQFQRGFARVELGSDYLVVSDGVVRGTEIGSTFQGTVYDSKGNMNLTGTFMPAYGLNRLFADVPIVGALLGNGRDRGLIGITYRLTGKTSSPKLEINPLSVIAPGVFRQIFEF